MPRLVRWAIAGALGVAIVGLTVPPKARAGDGVTTILVVRHAEKGSERDPDTLTELSGPGRERAEKLADVAGAYNVSAVVATEYCRTMQTVDPTAAKLSEKVIYVLPIRAALDDETLKRCKLETPTKQIPVRAPEYAGLSSWLLQNHNGQTVLIAQHSDEIEPLVQKISNGTESVCPDPIRPTDGKCVYPNKAKDKGETRHRKVDQYHRLFILKLTDGNFSGYSHTTYPPGD